MPASSVKQRAFNYYLCGSLRPGNASHVVLFYRPVPMLLDFLLSIGPEILQTMSPVFLFFLERGVGGGGGGCVCVCAPYIEGVVRGGCDILKFNECSVSN